MDDWKLHAASVIYCLIKGSPEVQPLNPLHFMVNVGKGFAFDIRRVKASRVLAAPLGGKTVICKELGELTLAPRPFVP